MKTLIKNLIIFAETFMLIKTLKKCHKNKHFTVELLTTTLAIRNVHSLST